MPEITLTVQQALMRAAAACECGQFAEAERLCGAILQSQPAHFVTLYLLAIAQSRRGDFAAAISSCDKALVIHPNHAETLHMRGSLLQELKLFEEALASYDGALAVRPDFAESHDNRAVILHELRHYHEALCGFDRALAIRPNHAATLNNRGNTLHALQHFEEALASYDEALAIEPDRAGTFNNRGYALQELKRVGEARSSFETALALDPAHQRALSGLAECALKLCDWKRRDQIAETLRHNVTEASSIVYPFILLGYSDDAALHQTAARRFIRNRIAVSPSPLWQGQVWRNDRIKLAYVSADFRSHPVAQLIAELFELHDRSRFEVIGISSGVGNGSDMRARLVKSFDQFYDVQATPDRDVATMLHGLRTDIVIDLSGYTLGCRPEILASRPAPIAVNYLGYPGTMSVDFVDYIIADRLVLPFDRQPYYVEKIVHVPGSYQVNDRKRAIAVHTPAGNCVGCPHAAWCFVASTARGRSLPRSSRCGCGFCRRSRVACCGCSRSLTKPRTIYAERPQRAASIRRGWYLPRGFRRSNTWRVISTPICFSILCPTMPTAQRATRCGPACRSSLAEARALRRGLERAC